MNRTVVKWMLVLVWLLGQSAWAQQLSKQESERIWAEAKVASRAGPATIVLGNQAKLELPVGRIYIAQPHASRVLNAMGNPGKDARLQGLVFPNEEDGWFLTIRFEDAGYVKDDDAKEWNADDLLQSYKEGTEASNEERGKMGVPAIEILGWAEKPSYDAQTHRLVWAMSSQEKAAEQGKQQGVNYNTYALGRDGYYSLNLVTDLAALSKYKPEAHKLLNALQFNEGKRYADFNSSTDKVAEYGLAALVVGVAAKKLGLFALIAVFVAKFAKIIFVAVVAFGAIAVRYFTRRKDDDTVPSQRSRTPEPPVPAPVVPFEQTHPLPGHTVHPSGAPPDFPPR